jgi:NAD(P)-dependent dehydrogenase (short-subunit alcohol dehydrogenase family)
LQVNVTSNHVLAEEAATILAAQRLPAAIVLTSSANAIVPKYGSEPYDVSKAALNHLIRELAMRFGPIGARVNGIAPATVVAGSAMFPRDRVVVSLEKYRFRSARTTARRRCDRSWRSSTPVVRSPPRDSAGRLRQRDPLARWRRQRQDHRSHHPSIGGLTRRF